MSEREEEAQAREVEEAGVELKVHLVRRSYRNGQWVDRDFERTEHLEVKGFVTTPAVIRLGRSLTVNLGDFESAKTTFEVQVPCYREELNEAVLFARSLVKTTMDEELRLLHDGDFDREEPPERFRPTKTRSSEPENDSPF